MGFKVLSNQTILGFWDHTNTHLSARKTSFIYSFFLLKEHNRSRYLAKNPPGLGGQNQGSLLQVEIEKNYKKQKISFKIL